METESSLVSSTKPRSEEKEEWVLMRRMTHIVKDLPATIMAISMTDFVKQMQNSHLVVDYDLARRMHCHERVPTAEGTVTVGEHCSPSGLFLIHNPLPL